MVAGGAASCGGRACSAGEVEVAMSMADVRWSFGEFPDCDPRWSWCRDGASAFELERGRSHASFLRETYPAFFA